MNLILLILILALPSNLRVEDGLPPISPFGYLSSFDHSIFISGSRSTYLGSTEKDGTFIALGNRGGCYSNWPDQRGQPRHHPLPTSLLNTGCFCCFSST
jgi:hypothetical protein